MTCWGQTGAACTSEGPDEPRCALPCLWLVVQGMFWQLCAPLCGQAVQPLDGRVCLGQVCGLLCVSSWPPDLQ